MTILLIGGTGKTGLPLARLLEAAKYSVLLTSRSGKAPEPFKAVAFDWFDAATFENPFNVDAKIDRVYLITPRVYDSFPIVKPFIDLAISKGVKRFVLMSASRVEAGGPGIGKVHQYLVDVGVDYVVLRPTWFMQNFAVNFSYSIRENNEISSATKDGRIPFVSVQDIAQAAFEALTAEKSANKDYLLLGPELYSYDEAVKLLSSILGREITHKRSSVEEQTATMASFGLPADLAEALANMQLKVADGSEAEYFNANADQKIVGKHTLKEFFETNRALWIK